MDYKFQEKKDYEGMSSISEIVSLSDATKSSITERTEDLNNKINDIEKQFKKKFDGTTRKINNLVSSNKSIIKNIQKSQNEFNTNINILKDVDLFICRLIILSNNKVKKFSKFLKCRKGHQLVKIDGYDGIGTVYQCVNCNTLEFELENK